MDDFLSWPFFTDAHREASSRLRSWLEPALSDLAERERRGLDVFAIAADAIRILGEGGWLRCLAPNGSDGSRARPDVRLLCLIRQELAKISSVADAAFAVQGLGSVPIMLFGDDMLRQRYLPALLSGTRIAAFALSEPGAGSDVAALSTTGRLEGDCYVLNGEKSWISNAKIASHYVVFARTEEAAGVKGLSAFVVDAATPGLEIVQPIDVIAPHPLAQLRFVDCRIPTACRLGDAGDGFKVAMTTLDIFRPSVGAAAIGLAERAMDCALDYASSRKIAGEHLSELQMTQGRIADMATELDAAKLLVYRAAWVRDSVEGRVSREPAMAKLYATEASQQIIDWALQMHGGRALVSGHPVEMAYREVRALRIYEGASEVQKLIIARQILKEHADGNADRA
ncbi:MAG: acyl-CoA dehydrogenase [Rhodospirillaceae bacterium]|nr:acyl-CoA dehydrogenase [Rhodospirillaceae bacterium]